jgi:hypothetical protein
MASYNLVLNSNDVKSAVIKPGSVEYLFEIFWDRVIPSMYRGKMLQCRFAMASNFIEGANVDCIIVSAPFNVMNVAGSKGAANIKVLGVAPPAIISVLDDVNNVVSYTQWKVDTYFNPPVTIGYPGTPDAQDFRIKLGGITTIAPIDFILTLSFTVQK